MMSCEHSVLSVYKNILTSSKQHGFVARNLKYSITALATVSSDAEDM
jgi:hypothetical protein